MLGRDKSTSLSGKGVVVSGKRKPRATEKAKNNHSVRQMQVRTSTPHGETKATKPPRKKTSHKPTERVESRAAVSKLDSHVVVKLDDSTHSVSFDYERTGPIKLYPSKSKPAPAKNKKRPAPSSSNKGSHKKRSLKKHRDGNYNPKTEGKGTGRPGSILNAMTDSATELKDGTKVVTSVMPHPKKTPFGSETESRLFQEAFEEKRKDIPSDERIVSVTKTSATGTPIEGQTTSGAVVWLQIRLGLYNFYSNQGYVDSILNSKVTFLNPDDPFFNSSIFLKVHQNSFHKTTHRILLTPEVIKAAKAVIQAGPQREQTRLMGGSATELLCASGILPPGTVAHWSHSIMFAMLAFLAQHINNLACATKPANALDLLVEILLLSLAKQYTEGFIVEVASEFIPNTYILIQKTIKLITSDCPPIEWVINGQELRMPHKSILQYNKVFVDSTREAARRTAELKCESDLALEALRSDPTLITTPTAIQLTQEEKKAEALSILGKQALSGTAEGTLAFATLQSAQLITPATEAGKSDPIPSFTPSPSASTEGQPKFDSSPFDSSSAASLQIAESSDTDSEQTLTDSQEMTLEFDEMALDSLQTTNTEVPLKPTISGQVPPPITIPSRNAVDSLVCTSQKESNSKKTILRTIGFIGNGMGRKTTASPELVDLAASIDLGFRSS